MSEEATTPCACCGALRSAERAPVQLGSDGLPLALAVMEGLGVPVVDPGSVSIIVRCDDVDVFACVGFSRPLGKAWRFQAGPGGKLIVRDGDIVVEEIYGAITLAEPFA